MAPVFLLGSAIYLGLRLAQMKLSHEKFLIDAEDRIKALEAEIAVLEDTQKNQAQVVIPASSQSTPPQKRWGLW
ncbi:hypothetical protein BKA70DRAFT_1420184 [Coprinopsis sp. MPI-PUGE-AT-0042]|nr:hypothetical protein BKA70DRAFT_1420184 [Coprinopsis sp. MPI-PUGE-AT-0042]